MADEATIGLMIWDQESIGTLLNVYRLIARNKKIVVYLVPEKRFVELRNASDLDSLMNGIDDVLRAKFSGRAKLEESISALLMQSSFFDSDRTGKFANQHR